MSPHRKHLVLYGIGPDRGDRR